MLRFKLGRLEVGIDFFFVALVTFFLLTDSSGISVIALLACLIHETGHLIVFLLAGYVPQSLTFELGGIRLQKPEQELSPWREVLVQLAGSAANFSVFFLLIGSIGQISGWSIFAVTHLVLGIFNLLPLRGLDGGKLAALFFGRFFPERTAYLICSVLDLTCLVLLSAAGVFLFFRNPRSVTLLMFAAGSLFALAAKAAGKKNFSGRI